MKHCVLLLSIHTIPSFAAIYLHTAKNCSIIILLTLSFLEKGTEDLQKEIEGKHTNSISLLESILSHNIFPKVAYLYIQSMILVV